MDPVQSLNEIIQHAETLETEKNWGGAIKQYSLALISDPNNPELMDKMGWCLSRNKEYDDAVIVFKDLVNLQPQIAKWYYMVGYQFYAQEKYTEAIEWFGKSLQIDDNNMKVLYRCGRAYVYLSQSEVAVDYFTKCVNIWQSFDNLDKQKIFEHEYSRSCFHLGKYLLDVRKNPERAINAFEQALSYTNPEADDYYNFGKALFEANRYQDALENFIKAQGLNSHKEYIIRYIGKTYLKLDNYQLAEQTYLSIPPRKRKPYILREMAEELYIPQGEFGKAIDVLKIANRIEAENYYGHYLIGECYLERGDIVTAYQSFQKANAECNSINRTSQNITARLEAIKERAELENIDLENYHSPTDGNIIKTFNHDRGFGFIKRHKDTDVFFHISEVSNPDQISIGSSVIYDRIEESKKGLAAVKITVMD